SGSASADRVFRVPLAILAFCWRARRVSWPFAAERQGKADGLGSYRAQLAAFQGQRAAPLAQAKRGRARCDRRQPRRARDSHPGGVSHLERAGGTAARLVAAGAEGAALLGGYYLRRKARLRLPSPASRACSRLA